MTAKETVFTFLDLEMDQPSREIIEIGAVIVNLKTNTVLERVEAFVKLDHPLNPEITKLTTITDQMLEEKGTTLLEAYHKVKEAHERHGAFNNPWTWGGGDHYELQRQLTAQYAYADIGWCFGNGYWDVKKQFQLACIANDHRIRSGLAKALTRVGLTFKGTKHRAVDDAYNTFAMAVYLLHCIKKDVIKK